VTPLRALADAYVRDGSYATTTYGQGGLLEVKKVALAGYSRESYLRFDLSTLGSITSGKLRLYGKQLTTAVSSMTVGLSSVASTTWSESFGWNARPVSGATIASATVSGTTGKWYEFDVGSYLRAQKAAGATSVAFALKGTFNSEGWIGFDSDEAVNRPQLVVT
jgi:endoglucanase